MDQKVHKEFKVCKVKGNSGSAWTTGDTRAAWSKRGTGSKRRQKEILEKPGYKDCRGYRRNRTTRFTRTERCQLVKSDQRVHKEFKVQKEIKEIKAREVTVV